MPSRFGFKNYQHLPSRITNRALLLSTMNENRIYGMDIVLMLHKSKLRKVYDEGDVDAIIENIMTLYTLEKRK
jgi:hypothetical protein